MGAAREHSQTIDVLRLNSAQQFIESPVPGTFSIELQVSPQNPPKNI